MTSVKTPSVSIAKQRIAARRIAAQCIENSHFESAAEVVEWMGAMQAQDYAMAKWAVGLRLPGSNDLQIEAALDKGELIRTHILRPTWHLVSARDIRWMLALSAPYVKAKTNSQNIALELNEPLFKRSNDLIIRALEGGKHLTRPELMALLEENGIHTGDNRSTYFMFRAELDGLVCNGTRRGKQFTYALLDERVPAAPTLPREEALAMLAERYFTSHGPATVKDFAWWSGLPVKDIRSTIEAIRPALGSVTQGDEVYYFSLTHPPASPGATGAGSGPGTDAGAAGAGSGAGAAPASMAAPASSRGAHLLPAFDEYLVSYQDRSPLLPPSLFGEVFTKNGIFRPLILLNGKIAGTWKRTLKKDKVQIELTPFGELSKTSRQSIASAAARYGRFLGCRAEVVN